MKTRAFTLIELLVAISLISAITVAMFYFSLSSIKLVNRALADAKSLQVTRFIMARISSDYASGSGAGSGSGPLRLVIGNISYEFRDNKLRRQEGSDSYYMTVEGEIKGLRFYYPSQKMVRIEIIPNTGGAFSESVYARN